MSAAITDKFQQGSGSDRPVVTSLSVPKSAGSNTATISSASGWSTASAIPVTIFRKDTNNQVVQGSQTDWTAVLVGNVLTQMVLRAGTEPTSGYPADSLTVVKSGPTAAWADDLYEGLTESHNPDGSLKTAAVQSALGLTNLSGYTPLGVAPNTVTYNGNRSYDLVFNGDDLTDVLSNGMRLRTTRTVTAPTQCTSLNGTNQYFSKTSPAGMTFTDDFVVSAWVKLSSYPSGRVFISSRSSGVSGWELAVESSGQVMLIARNGSSSNFSLVQSYQSLPLNKWVHVTAQLDMSAFTATSTTSYIMFDGNDVPASVLRGGTNPTTLAQAGNLEVGSAVGVGFFPGKIAQAAVFNAKVTQATMRTYISQGLAGTETSLISAYSFNNSINDLNTTNANNLTANGSAVATNADSPFTQDDTGTPSGTNDFAIITKKVFSTNTTLTVQVPEGCTIPTSGGVSAVVYSSNKAPYGFPGQEDRWQMLSKLLVGASISSPTGGVWYNIGSFALTVPVGAWKVSYSIGDYGTINAVNVPSILTTLSTSTSTQSDSDFSTRMQSIAPDSDAIWGSAYRTKPIPVISTTTYYLNFQSLTNSATSIFIGGSPSITAELTYL